MGPVALRVACVAAYALAAFVAPPARAQSLVSLHVRSFTMAAAPTQIRVGDTFKLTISAHVDEVLLELDNVTLPNLAGFDVLGDERRCSATGRGSDCVETLDVSPTVAGDRTIAAAIMDAIDARNGKPSRFSTNSVALRVSDAPPHLPPWIGELVWSLVLAIVPLAAAAFVLYAILRNFGKRTTVAVRTLAVPPPPPPPIDRDAELRAMVAALAADPSRERALALRGALRERLGAREDETLADLGRRYRNGSHPHLIVALGAVERASFCEDARVARAVEEALPSLNF